MIPVAMNGKSECLIDVTFILNPCILRKGIGYPWHSDGPAKVFRLVVQQIHHVQRKGIVCQS